MALQVGLNGNLVDRNSKESLTKWLEAVVSGSSLSIHSKKRAMKIGSEVIANDGWRGEISDRLLRSGYCNRDFEYELCI